MSVLQELNDSLSPILPVESGVFSKKAPNEYLVLTPITDVYALHADNKPLAEVSHVRISLFSKGNYLQRKAQVVKALLAAGFTITDRRYIEFETDTEYHHYNIDVAKNYFAVD